MRATLVILLSLTLVSCHKPAPAAAAVSPWEDSPGFWIWNRYTPLSENSVQQLQDAGPSTICWLFAEIPASGDSPRKQLNPSLLDQLAATPVIRLPVGNDTLTSASIRTALRKSCHTLFHNSSGNIRLQLDYDCPASGLVAYANLLGSLRQEFHIDQLSVTALASWIDAPGFATLAAAVDEFAPMFYDLEPDLPADIIASNPLPMVDASTLRWIEKWQRCPRPWRVGLPNFQRLSLFRADGHLIGHLQRWSPDTILSHPSLKLSPDSTPSILQFSVTANTHISQVALKPGQLLIWRMPEQSIILRALDTARSAGARGCLWFAHPDSAPLPWHTVPHLAALQRHGHARPRPVFTLAKNGAVILSNHGPGDFPNRYHQRPWQLILDAKNPGSFQSPGPGEFFSIDAPGSSLARPELSKKIVLSFHALPAGKSLHSQEHFLKISSQAPDWQLDPNP